MGKRVPTLCHTVLPWERDADLTFLTANFTAFAKLNKYIRKKYYYSDDPGSLWCCADNRTAGGKIKVSSKNWHIELYGQHLIDSEMLQMDGVEPTKALLDGQWVGAPKFPSPMAREIFRLDWYISQRPLPNMIYLFKSISYISYKIMKT